MAARHRNRTFVWNDGGANGPECARCVSLRSDARYWKGLMGRNGSGGQPCGFRAAFATERGEVPEIVHPIAAHHGDENPQARWPIWLRRQMPSVAPARALVEKPLSPTRSEWTISKRSVRSSWPRLEALLCHPRWSEVRIHVDPHRVDDLAAVRLAGDVAGRIEEECVYPGQIKVTILRETTSSSMARG